MDLSDRPQTRATSGTALSNLNTFSITAEMIQQSADMIMIPTLTLIIHVL